MLTDSRIRAAKAADKSFKLYDQNGLFMLVTPAGGKLWRLKYNFAGRELSMSLGKYPEVKLTKARARRDSARELLADGVDPMAVRRLEKDAQCNTFKSVALEFLERNGTDKCQPRLEKYVFPAIGNMPINTVSAPDLLGCLRRIEQRGIHETAHRIRSLSGRIFRYAIATGRAERDVAADLKGALIPHKTRHYPFVKRPEEVGALLRAISDYRANPIVELALRLLPYLFVRPGELRKAEWSEIEGDIWRIPSEKMKMEGEHLVPLSKQARGVIDELQQWSGDSRFLFPNMRSKERPMSENALNAALRQIGYTKDQMTGHGFRKIASTLLHELSFDPLWIEAQLAHKLPGVHGIYNKAVYLPQRVTMMQSWSDYLDQLRDGTKITPIRKLLRRTQRTATT